MKALKLFLLTLFAALGLSAQAQTIEVYKDGRVIDTFPAAQVDSVVYKYAEPQARYYYYAGWECPTTEAELASKGTLINGDVNSFTYNFAATGNKIVNPAKDYGTVYFVIPSQLSLYDNLGTDIVADQYDEESKTIGGVTYRVLTSKDEFYDMDFLNIKKKQ